MANRSDSEVADICEMTAMASLVGDLIIAAFEFVVWAVWELLPSLCYFTGLALVFAATLGKASVERPSGRRIGWTGVPQITRSPQGRVVLPVSLGVIISFVFWAIVASAVLVVRAWRS